MAPVDGWYPDPAGMPQLRFWNGQNWTADTAPAQGTQSYPQQSYPAQTVTMPPRGVAPSGGSPTHRAPKRGKGFYGIIAGIAAVAVGVAVIIPLTSGGSHHAPPTNAALTSVLLSVADVSGATTLPFAVDNSSDDSSSDGDTSGCIPGNAVDKAEKAARKADGSQTFVSKKAGLELDEDIAYYPGQAAALMTAEKSAFQQCPTFKEDGDTINVSFVPGLSVKGADDVEAVQISGTISGTPVLGDTFEARFGDVIVGVDYFSVTKAPQDLNVIAAKLLQQAALKAKPVL
jgi:hypothetical protein